MGAASRYDIPSLYLAATLQRLAHGAHFDRGICRPCGPRVGWLVVSRTMDLDPTPISPRELVAKRKRHINLIFTTADMDQSCPGDQSDVHLNCSAGLSISSVKGL